VVGSKNPVYNARLRWTVVLLAVLLEGEKMLGIERPLVLTGNKNSCYNLRLC
jgi:hypothetical protein